MKNPRSIIWRLPSEKPIQDSWVIIETLDGDYIEDYIGCDEVFDTWDESVIRWGYSHAGNKTRGLNDDFDFSKYMNLPKEDKYVKKVLRDDFNLHVTDKINNSECDTIKYEYKDVQYTSPDWERESRRWAELDKWVKESMDGFRSWVFNSDKDKGTSNEKDSSESESVSDKDPYTIVANYLKATPDKERALEKIEEIIKMYEKH